MIQPSFQEPGVFFQILMSSVAFGGQSLNIGPGSSLCQVGNCIKKKRKKEKTYIETHVKMAESNNTTEKNADVIKSSMSSNT